MEISTKTLHFIEEHREDDTRTLALQSKKYPDVDMAAAVTQIAGRQVAARKIPSWYPVSAQENNGIALDWKIIDFVQVSLREELYNIGNQKNKGVVVERIDLLFQ